MPGGCVVELLRLIEELEKYSDVLDQLPAEDRALAELLMLKKGKLAAGLSA